jgi:hypothetical protein
MKQSKWSYVDNPSFMELAVSRIKMCVEVISILIRMLLIRVDMFDPVCAASVTV